MALTGKQELVLRALLAEAGGGALQKDIKPATTAADRKALQTEGLIQVVKRGPSLWLEATERGRAWVAQNPAAAKPTKSKPAARKAPPKKAMTPAQKLLLLALLPMPGPRVWQKDLATPVKDSDRAALSALGMIELGEGPRGETWLEVTERGWAWAADNLDADLPKTAKGSLEVLRSWLKRVKSFLEAKGFALADLLAPAASSASLPERIRAAYLAGAGALNQRLFLSQLREKLPDVDRVALDEALRAMHGHDGMQLSGTDNPRELSPADRAAGLDYKGETMFVIWMTR
jgi:hypothetical protein